MVSMAPRLACVITLLVLLSATHTLTGCAYVSLDLATTTVIGVRQGTVSEGETNQRTFPHSIEKVYAGLLASVERDGRRVVDRDPGQLLIRVSYPFSWLQNNWGGTITVSCTSGKAQDGYQLTTVHVFGSKSDAHSRLTKMGDKLLNDLAAQLALP